MDKLEQAIRKTASEGNLQTFHLERDNTSCIEEIKKMESSFLLDEESLKRKKIIYPGYKNNRIINSFRELRTNISKETNKNLVMVTSICANAGTSYFARNIAAAIAFDVSKTSLLVDCSLSKKENLSHVFNLENNKGIIDYIEDNNETLENIIYESGIKRLKVLPYGGNGLGFEEYFSHPRFQSLLNQIKNKYKERRIILDSPPLLDSADAQILLNLCDQVIVIVPYGKGNNAKLEAIAKLIGREKFKGVVFNDYVR